MNAAEPKATVETHTQTPYKRCQCVRAELKMLVCFWGKAAHILFATVLLAIDDNVFITRYYYMFVN